MEFKIIHNSNIDKSRWDELLDACPDAKVYSKSWYLDCVSPNWKLLVNSDYSLGFPLTISKKYGFIRLLQAPYSQQLTICSTENASEIVQYLPFKYINLTISELPKKLEDLNFEERINIELNLNYSYDEIAKKYNENTRRNLKKASEIKIQIKEDISIEDFLKFKRDALNFSLKEKIIRILNTLLNKAESLGKAEKYAAYIDDNLCALVYLIKDTNRLYMIQSVSNELAYEKSVTFFLLDYIFRKYAGQNIIFDFEGSMIPGVARFFKGFGGEEKSYYRIYRNNYSSLLKLFVK